MRTKLQFSRLGLVMAVATFCATSVVRGQPGDGLKTRPTSRRGGKSPNIVFILADDLGYGDVRCLNPNGKIPTPQLDRLAADGMIFTDAHSPSSVCTPTRYSILTGRYNWRSRLQSGVLGGLSPRLIEKGRLTVASMLRGQGYHTACFGKWHLGMDWARLPGKPVAELEIETAGQVRNVDFAQPIRNGPNALGFDDYFGISASLDMVPYTFIKNDRVVELPTEDKQFPMRPGAPGQTRRGPGAARLPPGQRLSTARPGIRYRASPDRSSPRVRPRGRLRRIEPPVGGWRQTLELFP